MDRSLHRLISIAYRIPLISNFVMHIIIQFSMFSLCGNTLLTLCALSSSRVPAASIVFVFTCAAVAPALLLLPHSSRYAFSGGALLWLLLLCGSASYSSFLQPALTSPTPCPLALALGFSQAACILEFLTN